MSTIGGFAAAVTRRYRQLVFGIGARAAGVTACHEPRPHGPVDGPFPFGMDLAKRGDPVPSPSSVSSFPRRVVLGAVLLALVGFAIGAVGSRAVGRLVAVPEDAERTQYIDGPPSPAAPGEASAVAAAETPAEHPSPRPRVMSLKQYADIIVRRNIFDSTAVYDPNAAKTTGSGECRSDASVRIVATVVAEIPAYSSALVQLGGKDARATGYVVGDALGGEGRIVSIEPRKVCVDGGVCFCSGAEGALAGRSTAGADSGAGSGVEKLSDTRYAVDQSVIDEALQNVEMLATQMRATPHKGPDGQIDGFRLQSIKKGSLFSKLGITNGDIVHSVNGRELTSTEGALSAYQALRNERNFSFEITRKGQRMTLEYDVR